MIKRQRIIVNFIAITAFSFGVIATAFGFDDSFINDFDNGPILELMDDVTVCSGSAIILSEIPIIETTGMQLDYSFHSANPVSDLNEILTENLVVTSNDTIYAAASDGTCQTVLEIPIEFVLSPVLTTNDVVTICSGEEFDLSSLNIEDLENTGSVISFHTSNNPSSDNIINNLIISPDMTTSVYAYSELGVCSYTLPISINVVSSPDLFVTTEPVICTGLDLDLSTLLLTDLNNTGAPISIHTSLPGNDQNEITGQTVNYSNSTIIYAVAQSGNCQTELPINVTVTSSLYAGENNTGMACVGNGDFELSELVTPNSNPGAFVPVLTNSYFNEVTNTMNTNIAPSGIYSFLYIVEAEGQCLPDTAFLDLELMPATSAGADNFREICEGISGPVSMSQFLNGATSSAGFWRQLTGPSIDVSDPANVDFSSIPSDTLLFQYVVQEPAECKADTSIITIDVTPSPELDGVQLRCAEDLNSYTFAFWTEYTNVTVDFGTIVQVGTEFQVQDIPITQAINITLVNEKNCSNTIHINPPDCDCAFVPLPTQVYSVSVCEGDPVPPMSINLEAGVGANWYDAAEGGELLFGNGIAFNPSINAVGSYTYYVEVYSLFDENCVNESRVEVTLDIFPYPSNIPVVAFGCVTDDIATFDFDAVANSLDPTGQLHYAFYASEADANSNSNALPNVYEANINGLDMLYATVEYGGGCQTVVSVELKISPNPDVTFGTNNIDCENETGGVYVVNNDPSQEITFSYNLQDFTTVLEQNNLFGGNAILRAKNEFGCIVEEWVVVEVQTGFSIESMEFVCDGNGTPSDATDDFQVVSVLLETTTNSPSYEIIDSQTGDSFGVHPFGQMVDIVVPVNGNWYILDFVDTLDPLCSESVTLGYLETCSTQCGITNIEIVGSECFDNNTPENPFDDKFYLDVEVLAVNASDSWILDGPLQFTGNYTDVQRVGPFDIDDHPGVLIFQDDLSSDCFYELLFDVPNTCSNQCAVELVEFNNIACDDAFTGPISEDDIYLVSFIFSNINTGKTSYFIEIDGNTLGPFLYDELVEIPGVTSSSQELTVFVMDEENGACLQDYTVLLMACSECIESTEIITETLNLNCVGDPEFPEINLSLEGQYSWTHLATGSMFSSELSPGIDELGLFEIFVNHDNLCVSKDTLEVIQENIIPVADAGEDLIINCFDPSVSLQGTTMHPSNIRYDWFDENNNLVTSNETGDFTTSQEGTYYLSVIDTLRKCVSDLSAANVLRDDVVPNLTIDIFPNDTLTCFSEEININLLEDLSNYKVSWVVQGDTLVQDSLIVTSIGLYDLEVQDLGNGCIQHIDFEIHKNADYPLVEIDFPDTLNCLNSTITLDASMSSNESVIVNQWYQQDFEELNGEQDLVLEVDEGGMYYLQLSNLANGCVELDSIFVVQDQGLPLIEAGSDDYIKCYEDNYMLNGSLFEDIDDYTVAWYNYGTNVALTENILNPIITDTGIYLLHVVNNINYCETYDTVQITKDPNLIKSVDIFSDDPLCYLDENGIIVIQDVETEGTGLEYFFNGVQSPDGNILDNQVGGEFEISIRNAEGCSFDTLISLIDPYVLSLDLNTSAEETINLGDSLTIQAITNILPEDIANIEWSNPETHTRPNELTTTIFPYSRTSYEIIVTDENGCVVSSSLTVYVTEEIYLYFPNIFSLEPGSQNTEFIIHGDRQVEKITQFEIFDRWGNRVFRNQDFRPGEVGSGWDGYFDGVEASTGVYMYRVEALLKNGKQKFFIGDVTLVK